MHEIAITEWRTAGDAERRRILTRGGNAGTLDSDRLRADIGAIVESVRTQGDAALVDALRRFDKLDLTAGQLAVSEQEIAAARAAVSPALLDAIRTSIARSRAFNAHIVERANWMVEAPDGSVVGERVAPIPAVGLFVPSGKGSFPSVAIQIATPAVVAGVPRLVAMVPPVPGSGGAIDPATIVALVELGVTEIFRCNGPAGIAALAFGTARVPKVDKIVGPGSPGVTVAQMLVQQFGTVVEVGLGPTDSAIVADATADPVLLAADLINEAEHGPDSSAVLICTDRPLLERVAGEIAPQLAALPEKRRGYALEAIAGNGGLVLASDLAEAVEIADEYAGEHLQLAVADPAACLERVRYAGTVLLGQRTTFAMSNFATGTPATLPTTGFARVTSGVTAHTYLVRAAVAGLSEEAFWELAPTVTALAEHEGFPAHAATVEIRRR